MDQYNLCNEPAGSEEPTSTHSVFLEFCSSLQGGTSCWCPGTLDVLPKHILKEVHHVCLELCEAQAIPQYVGMIRRFASEVTPGRTPAAPAVLIPKLSAITVYEVCVCITLQYKHQHEARLVKSSQYFLKSMKLWKEEANCSANVARAVQCNQPQLPWLLLVWERRRPPCYFKDFCQTFQLRQSKTETHQLYLEV